MIADTISTRFLPGSKSNRAVGGSSRTPRVTDTSLRLLLAEDDEDLRAFLAISFMIAGYQVSVASTGAQLIERLSDWILGDERAPPFDVLVTDVRLPGFDGLRVVEGLSDLGWHLPTIVMSVLHDPSIAARARSCPGVTFVPKPLSFGALEAQVRASACAFRLSSKRMKRVRSG